MVLIEAINRYVLKIHHHLKENVHKSFSRTGCHLSKILCTLISQQGDIDQLVHKFDFDKWNIRTDAQYELENIVDVMRKHPTMIIKIESHTDSRGGDRYNMKLSDRRAKATRDYIISRGIDASRIESAIGYGESQLLNKCSNGVKCTEEEHQLNRRSYFYIVNE